MSGSSVKLSTKPIPVLTKVPGQLPKGHLAFDNGISRYNAFPFMEPLAGREPKIICIISVVKMLPLVGNAESLIAFYRLRCCLFAGVNEDPERRECFCYLEVIHSLERELFVATGGKIDETVKLGGRRCSGSR